MSIATLLGDHAVSQELPVRPSLWVGHHDERHSEENELAPNEREQGMDEDMAGAHREDGEEES